MHGGIYDGIYVSDKDKKTAFEYKMGYVSSIYFFDFTNEEIFSRPNYNWKMIVPYEYYLVGAVGLFKCK
jgi:hypothetical protein